MNAPTPEQRAEAIKTFHLVHKYALPVGALLSLFGIYFVFTAQESLLWPTADGTVTATHVFSETIHSGPRSGDRSYHRFYNFKVAYSFLVDGKLYHNDQFSSGDGSSAGTRSIDQAAVANEASLRYPVGSNVTVYYDQHDPTLAVLSPGAGIGTYVPLILGALVLFLAWGAKRLGTMTEQADGAIQLSVSSS